MAVNTMHTDVERIVPAVEEIRRQWDGVLGAYAHHGGWEPPHWIFHDISPEDYAQAALGWVAQVVQIIGACLRHPACGHQVAARAPARQVRSRRDTGVGSPAGRDVRDVGGGKAA